VPSTKYGMLDNTKIPVEKSMKTLTMSFRVTPFSCCYARIDTGQITVSPCILSTRYRALGYAFPSALASVLPGDEGGKDAESRGKRVGEVDELFLGSDE
jgi:hypothetical protein